MQLRLKIQTGRRKMAQLKTSFGALQEYKEKFNQRNKRKKHFADTMDTKNLLDGKSLLRPVRPENKNEITIHQNHIDIYKRKSTA